LLIVLASMLLVGLSGSVALWRRRADTLALE